MTTSSTAKIVHLADSDVVTYNTSTSRIGASETKIFSHSPVGIRWTLKKSGEKVLQAAYPWKSHFDHGVEWKDVKTVVEE